MKLLSVSLGNRRGEFELFGEVNIPKKLVTFQVFEDGKLINFSQDFSEMREFLMEIVQKKMYDLERMS